MKREALSAMREAIRAHEHGRSVVHTRRPLAEFMGEWLPAVRFGLAVIRADMPMCGRPTRLALAPE